MKLAFQVMWIVIILSSVTQQIFTASYSLHRRQKRLMPYDCDSSDQREIPRSHHKPSKAINSKSRGTGIAVKAAQEAKQANDDMANAVKQASDRIKLEYAEKAASAAKAAEAVLSGKFQVLEQLEMEVREAEIVVQEETLELSSAEANSQLALKAHQQAQDELKLLQTGLKLARENFCSAEHVSAACQQSMAEKTTLMDTAQKRVGLLLRQLSEARGDYAKTKKAAYRALCAANEAKQRIQHTNTVN
ncbi:uncharacterized protein LOC133837467 [Drosophila sulfurigaster albostrigata]|uniref:uncharacterized protein LOC133837467 n=1 Tax=Drosophila sulfurigaster albostrigata TaxID=89887 RepID=UPI002D21E974|nr:uncharacterized protein LOC133837467 [Drosophila sulfurigaster albostrigata]